MGSWQRDAAASALYRKVVVEAADAARTASSERLNRAGVLVAMLSFRWGMLWLFICLQRLRRKETAAKHPRNGKRNICSNGGAHAQWKLCWGDLLKR